MGIAIIQILEEYEGAGCKKNDSLYDQQNIYHYFCWWIEGFSHQ